jgi:hypothetical protein
LPVAIGKAKVPKPYPAIALLVQAKATEPDRARTIALVDDAVVWAMDLPKWARQIGEGIRDQMDQDDS